MRDKLVGFGEYKRDWKINDSSLFVSLLLVKVAKDARFFFPPPPPLKRVLPPPLCRCCLLNPELERRERGRRRNIIIIISVRYYGEQTTFLFLWQLIG